MVSTFCLLFLIKTTLTVIIVLLLAALVIIVFRVSAFFLTFAFTVIFDSRTRLIFLRITLIGLPVGEEFLLKVEYPRMLENLYQWDSLLWHFHKEFVNKIFVLLGEFLLKLNFLADLVSCDCSLVASKWRISVDELI